LHYFPCHRPLLLMNSHMEIPPLRSASLVTSLGGRNLVSRLLSTLPTPCRLQYSCHTRRYACTALGSMILVHILGQHWCIYSSRIPLSQPTGEESMCGVDNDLKAPC
jgi:hypothetical protein